ncbi:hypothetical protein D1007_21204 [Hordeum vulgare]|nr:hypothetical protein D1007_21204 [Hordeum vulgare]
MSGLTINFNKSAVMELGIPMSYLDVLSNACVMWRFRPEVKRLSNACLTWRCRPKMDKIVNIHYVDKEAFMNVAIVDKYEEVLTFLDSPTYEEEVVASSIDKSLEVFASTVVNAPLHVDLNQPIVDDLSLYNGVAPIVEHKVEVQVNEYPQYEFGGSAPIKDDGHESDEEYERQHNIVGDVEAQVRHDDMDPDIVYQRACVDESDDEGPVNELDEDGFTEKEAEWYTKITERDYKVPLFCDVSLADKALVDGGMSKTIEARMFPIQYRSTVVLASIAAMEETPYLLALQTQPETPGSLAFP